MRLSLNAILMLILVADGTRAQQNAERVTIVKSPVTVVNRTFDPKNPPKEMPKLAPNEAAITSFHFSMEADADGPIVAKKQDLDGTDVEVRVDHVTLKPRLKVTIWLPPKPPKKVVDHENGHRKIAEMYYDKVDEKGKEAGGAIVGRTFSGHGRNTDAAQYNARVKALNEVNRAILDLQAIQQKVQDRYDRITDHSQKNIAVDEAIRKAIDEVERGVP